MRPRAILIVLAGLPLALSACATGGAVDASTTTPTAAGGLKLASPTATDPTVSSSPTSSAAPPTTPTSSAAPAAPGPTGRPSTTQEATTLKGFTLVRYQAVADPRQLLDAVAKATSTAPSYRLGLGGGPGTTHTTTGTVDRSDPRAPKADVWWFEKGSSGGVHITLVGDEVFTQFPKKGAEYARTPLADMPEEVRTALETYLHPMEDFGSDLTGPFRIEFQSLDTYRSRPEYFFKLLPDDGRPAYEHRTWTQFTVDSDLRLTGVQEYENGNARAYLRFSEYGSIEPIRVPPRRLVVDVPGRAWRDSMDA